MKSRNRGVDRRYVPIAQRLERNSMPEPNSGCLLWLGAIDGEGYGHTKVEGRRRGVHRIALERKLGRPLRPGELSCHKCDVRICINEDHLFPGSNDDNMADMAAKGRSVQPRGEQAARAKLTAEQVLAIRADPRIPTAIARDYGVWRTTIEAIKERRTWTHI
jgi:hypothetical protein